MAGSAQLTLEQAHEKLEKLHIRLSPQRSAVLELLYQQGGSRPSVETLVQLLSPRFPRLNATSVRNTVLVFEKMGLLPNSNPDRGNGNSSINAG